MSCCLVKHVIIPKDNEKDLVDIPQKIKDKIKFTPVETADEVLKIALTKELKPQNGLNPKQFQIIKKKIRPKLVFNN